MIESLTLVAFALVAGLVFLLLDKVRKIQRDPIGARLTSVASTSGTMDQRGLVDRQLVDALAGLLPGLKAEDGELAKDLRRAGYYSPTAARTYFAFRNTIVILSALMIAFLVVVVGPGREDIVGRILLVGLAAVILCWSLPRVFVSLSGRRRAERIRLALPFALDMVGMCLSGGMSLYHALTHVSREISLAHPDLAMELEVIRQQTDMNSLPAALTQFSQRIDLPDITAMAALITQNQRLGTNVGATVLEFADNIRLKRRQTADEQSAKAMLKLLFPVALCLMPAFFILFMGPTLVELSTFLRDFEDTASSLGEINQVTNQ